MPWKKSPPDLIATFQSVAPRAADVKSRQMFGYPACFVGGNMFMGLYRDCFVLRLSEVDRKALLAQPGARLFEPMPGRAMKEYVVVTPSLVGDEHALGGWIERALAYGRSLPAKSAKRPPSAKNLVEARKSSGMSPRPRKQSGTVKKAAPARGR